MYVPTIGLEIHAELRTRTKMFCESANQPFSAEPNTHVCPVCMAHPGTLPTINRDAVRQVLRVGVGVGGTLADYSEFDRKNYFYPDLPKGYQLSQYEYPLVVGGELAGVALTRIHLEEDTASSIHDEGSGATLIDYNRAGVPLMELVTEPVIHSPEAAGKFARELQLLLRYLGVSDANMERGEMRVEANVSVQRTENREQRTENRNSMLGTKVEIKNLNSFNAMERAIRYEIERQIAMLDRGERVEQQTLGWDEAKQATFAQRTKEGSADYRYFPDPDLPSLRLSEVSDFAAESIEKSLPELPAARRERYLAAGLKGEDAELFVRDSRLGDIFDQVASILPKDAQLVAGNYIANDLVGILSGSVKSVTAGRDIEERDSVLKDEIPFSAENFAELIGMVVGREISSKTAKEILAAMCRGSVGPRAYAESHSLLQKNDVAALEATVTKVIETHASVASDYRAGKAAALEFLVGQCMKELRGAADPAVLRELLAQKLRG